ncbi:MAG TPA: electron transfer flavoprotein subunit alpha/FixB family protein [Candidatus Bathyarchaeia archaeon]|nr:electron transfer flavoprotein subunit alpha/FixB family protein [Candidatus Bathyarchaeia archaeon]
MNSTKSSGVWIVGEQKDGQLAVVTLELLTIGRLIANSLKEQLTVIIIGNKLEYVVEILREYGANRIVLVSGECVEHFIPEVHSDSIAALIAKDSPSVILFPATYDGRDVAARLSAKLGVGLAADCTDLTVDEQGRFIQVRPAFGGNLMAVIAQSVTTPQLATLRPHIVKPAKSQQKIEPVVEHSTAIGLSKLYDKAILKTVREVIEEYGNLDEAEVVIGVGRGLGNVANLKMVNQLATLLDAAVGGSRGVVDKGWLPHNQQIGLTGRVISPKMYLALGISGAVQHLVGVRTAKEIVAVNIDANAPIFKVATFGIVGDLAIIVPALIKQLDSKISTRGRCASKGLT